MRGVAESIGTSVLLSLFVLGSTSNAVAMVTGHGLGSEGLVMFGPILGAAIGSSFRDERRFPSRQSKREFRVALRTGEIPARADTTGWLFALQEGEGRWVVPFLIVLASAGPVLAVIGAVRVHSELTIAIATMVTEIGLFAVLAPGYRDRARRRARLRTLLLDRVAEQDASIV